MKPKRVVSLLVAGCMAVSMVPASAVTAFAEEAAGTGSSITAPATVKVEVTLDGTQTLQEAVEAKNSDLASITELKVTTTGSAALTKAEFQFMGGPTVTDYFNWSEPTTESVYLSALEKLDLSDAKCVDNTIPTCAFRKNSTIKSIILPSTLETIGMGAFRDMSKLEYIGTNTAGKQGDPVTFPSSLTTIAQGAIMNDTGLTGNVILPAGVSLGAWAFSGSAVTGEIKIDGDVKFLEAQLSGGTGVNQYAFNGTGITSVKFNGSEIPKSFAQNTKLNSIVIGKNVKTIGSNAFYHTASFGGENSEISTIVIPETVQTICDSAFANAGKIDSIIVENPDVQYQAANNNARVCFTGLNGTKIYVAKSPDYEGVGSYPIWDSDTYHLDMNGGYIPDDGNGGVNAETETYGTVTLYKPVKDGYVFDGWYFTSANTVNETKLTSTPSQGRLYTAKWKCAVSFETNGHGEKPADVVVEPGQMLNNIPSPGTADGWVFDGWYLDSDFNHEFTTTEIINQNTTVYAKWHEFTNTTVTATASKDGEYLLSKPVEIDFKVNVGDDIRNISGISLEYGDEVESVKLNDVTLDKKDYTPEELTNILKNNTSSSNDKLTLTVNYKKTGKHTFSVVLKKGTEEACKASVDVTVVEIMMDATVTENGESKESYKANEPVKVTLKVTPSDLDAFKKDVLHLTYGEEVEKVELNGHKLNEKQYKISDLLDMMNSAASQVATYALGTEEVNIPLDVTYKTAGTHAFKMEVKNTEGALICQDSVNVTIAEEQKPDDGKKDDTKPENPVTTYALTVADGTVKVNGKDVAANESGAYAVEKDAKVEVTFDKTTLSDAQVFDQWTITPASVLNEVDPKSETISFTMPAEEVSIKAMTRDATIESDGPGVLGTAAMIGVGVAGTAVLGYQGYMIGTELYLNNVLPAGAAIPQNYGELALLVWTDAGKPAPAAVLAADATDEQKALTWAVENQLISADKAADASVTRWEVIRTWNQEQEMKKA